MVLHEPNSQQSLVINVRLLPPRMASSEFPSFVEVATSQPYVVSTYPPLLGGLPACICISGVSGIASGDEVMEPVERCRGRDTEGRHPKPDCAATTQASGSHDYAKPTIDH